MQNDNIAKNVWNATRSKQKKNTFVESATFVEMRGQQSPPTDFIDGTKYSVALQNVYAPIE